MTHAETLIVLFDTVFWSLETKAFKTRAERLALSEELREIIASFKTEYQHEHYKKINNVWTHSGSFQGYSIANNCVNKRNSFLVVLRGEMVVVSEDISLLRPGMALQLLPYEVRSGLVKPDSRIMRVFVNTEEELKTFLEAM